MRVRDVATFGSWSDLKSALLASCERYRKLLAAIKLQSRTERNLVLFNLCARSYEELDRLYRLLDEPPELTAWVARNLFEINLIVRFVVLSEENMNRWKAEMAGDERDILFGILGLSDGTHPEHEASLRKRIAEIEAILRRHNLEARKAQQTKALANLVGTKSEYDAFFKLYSKYVHPTSWLVNASPDSRNEWKGTLALQAQLYAGNTFVLIRDAVGVGEGAV